MTTTADLRLRSKNLERRIRSASPLTTESVRFLDRHTDLWPEVRFIVHDGDWETLSGFLARFPYAEVTKTTATRIQVTFYGAANEQKEQSSC